MKSSFISVCWINCSLRHPFLLMLISHEQRALIKCTVCAIINIGCCKGTGEVFTHLSPSNLAKVHLNKDMNLQINSKCTIWHFLYATQQNQAYMIILIFHNQSTGCNFMMDGLYLCVHTVLDFCWRLFIITSIRKHEKIISLRKIK